MNTWHAEKVNKYFGCPRQENILIKKHHLSLDDAHTGFRQTLVQDDEIFLKAGPFHRE